ncbi:hypothetical protein Tco_1524205 [Tanacetum coccineum]
MCLSSRCFGCPMTPDCDELNSDKIAISQLFKNGLVAISLRQKTDITSDAISFTFSQYLSEAHNRKTVQNSNFFCYLQDVLICLCLTIGVRKVLQERGFGSLSSSTETNPRDHVKSISTVVEADSYSIRCMGPSQYAKRRDHMDHNSRKLILKLHISIIPYPKRKDLGSFTLPCFINNVCFDNSLADLGANVSVMPLSTYLNLGLGELAHTKLTVELADRIVKYPKGIAENVLVGMGDVIFGEPFLREVRINERRFDGMITIYNGNEEVTYQMVRSHPKFKHHNNKQCNNIPPLLKLSEKDKMNGILHSYQKLKGFYKGVLNLGPEYVRDVKMEEWLTRGHISVHEME